MTNDIVYFKLVSGDDIVSYVDEELTSGDEDLVMLYKPLKIHTYNTPHGAAVRLAKWIPFIDETHIPVPVNKILISSSPSKDILNFYNEALDALEDMELNDVFDEDEEEMTQALYERFSNTHIVVH